MTTPKFKPGDIVYVRDDENAVRKALVHVARVEITLDNLRISYLVGLVHCSNSKEFLEEATFTTPGEAFEGVPVQVIKR